ncbi:hypothetical protein [Algicola sagamiensis]|uniref:hypothetical protein n=1 Tax=Algicola sagamiensis TaxID=163869 RepID=UPI000377D662|nr:hypothetical protein [Algicola sagamiensis]
MKKLTAILLSLGIMMFSSASNAEQFEGIELPDDFQTSATLAGQYPAVLSGFLKMPIMSVLDYFKEGMGDPEFNEEQFSYYHLYYTVNEKKVRIIVSDQAEGWTQVDIMVMEQQ